MIKPMLNIKTDSPAIPRGILQELTGATIVKIGPVNEKNPDYDEIVIRYRPKRSRKIKDMRLEFRLDGAWAYWDEDL